MQCIEAGRLYNCSERWLDGTSVSATLQATEIGRSNGRYFHFHKTVSCSELFQRDWRASPEAVVTCPEYEYYDHNVPATCPRRATLQA